MLNKKKIQALALALAVTTSTVAGNASLQVNAENKENVENTVNKAASDLANPTVTETENGKLVTWDCIWFGNYYQSDAEGKVKDPILWRVLKVDGNDAFLFADKALDQIPYCEGTVVDPEPDKWGNIQTAIDTDKLTWDICTIRSFLNGYGAEENVTKKDYTEDNFINTAFTQQEQEAILTTMVTSDKSSPKGNATEDKIYLLSATEAMNPEYGFVDDCEDDITIRQIIRLQEVEAEQKQK